MRLGIDFGTTRIVVATVDRGNYPVVSFDVPDESPRDWFPPLVAAKGDRRIYGWEAWAAQEEPGWTIVRSLKRALEGAGPQTLVQIGEQVLPMRQLLGEMISALRAEMIARSSLAPGKREMLEVTLGVPANANSNQRFLTVEAFREAGFRVLGLLNEPSAASIEFGHRDRNARQARETREKVRILVYDLGGGTFDASLVELDEREHTVIASEGISTLGGDDFDAALAELALDAAGVSAETRDSLTQAEMFRLHEECREKKESLHPNTRNITLDLGRVRSDWQEVSIKVTAFYERCRPLVEETLHATNDLLAAPVTPGPSADSEPADRLDALYVTGGGSELPLVARLLREVFGRRVRRSAYTRSATAIGLAIQADEQAGYVLRERFMRYFGVWREADGGRSVAFDPLFAKGMVLPGPSDPPLTSSRSYSAVHNVGHFRYLECSHVGLNGLPDGDITFWDDIRFPFDPGLHNGLDLSRVPVTHLASGRQQQVKELYACDATGVVSVTIANLSAGYNRQYRLGRWSGGDAPIVPGRKKKAGSK
jgi:molecular chaperone DnaK (HSP70)